MFSLRYRHNTSDPGIHTYGYKEKGDMDSHNKRSDEEDKDEEKASDSYNEKSPYSRRTTSYHHHNVDNLVPYTSHVFFEFILACMVRLWHSGVPQFLTQSELILAQQINWTLKGQFHIGTTPPLVTMLYSLITRWIGYQGSESILYAGQTMHEFPLATLRHVTIFISSLTIPAIYVFVRMLRCTHTTALFTSGLFIFETGMVVQSRYISVNPLLTLLCCLACCSFFAPGPLSLRRRFLVGTLLGSALCTKWQAGSFIAFFLSVSAYKIWQNLCDPTIPLKKIPKSIFGHFLTLLVLPISVYIVLFQYHFHKVPNAGEHDMFLSSPLRYSLKGNSFEPVQQYIAYGSHVVLKHVSSNNGYLHSDDKIFTAGSKQNQVTVYPYEDINNIWVIQKLDNVKYSKTDTPDYFYNNNAFKLEHYASTRKLHSHDHNAPIHNGEGFYEVTSYGNPSVTNDGNDVWWIRVVTEDEGYDTSNHDPINALTTRFRLLHSKGCYLSSHYNPLPLADGAQQEVSCMNSAKTSVASWVFEYAHHPKLENISPMIQYGHPTFRKKMEQVHKLMKNYKKVVYDRLSSLPADVLESTETMMDSDSKPEPFSWILRIYARVIWDDLTGKSVYVVFQPMIRYATLVCLGFLLMVALFSALSAQLGWTQSSTWCQQFWACRHIQTANIMMGGALINAIGILLFPAHTVSLSDLIPTIIFGTIAFTSLLEWFMEVDTFKPRRPLISSAGENTSIIQPAIFFTTPSTPLITDRIRQKLYHWIIYMLITLHIISFLRWAHGIDGSHMWTSGQCKQFSVQNVDCEKYPPTPPLLSAVSVANDSVSVIDPYLMEEGAPQEDHDDIMESRQIMMPGTPLRFEYERGQEIRAEMEIAKVREKAYRQANEFSVPAHRFVRASIDPGPPLEEVLDLRYQMYIDAVQKEEGNLPGLAYEDGIEIYEEEDESHLERKKKRATKKKNRKRKSKKVKKAKKVSKLTVPEFDDGGPLYQFPAVDLARGDE